MPITQLGLITNILPIPKSPLKEAQGGCRPRLHNTWRWEGVGSGLNTSGQLPEENHWARHSIHISTAPLIKELWHLRASARYAGRRNKLAQHLETSDGRKLLKCYPTYHISLSKGKNPGKRTHIHGENVLPPTPLSRSSFSSFLSFFFFKFLFGL